MSFRDRTVIAYTYDPEKKFAPREDELKTYFGLTDAQAKVAVRMYTSNNIKTVANDLKISINTARSHLRSIYEKMGAKNQSELVSTLTATIKNINQVDP